MIQIDRTSSIPVAEQLVQQLRFLIASGKYRIGEALPSTRALADQIGISFHTVRKAYQQLEQEGLLTSRVGSGFRVAEGRTVSRADQMEQGAAIVQEAVQRLIGLGLKETAIEYLFQEHLTFLERPDQARKLLFAAPYQEMAELCAQQVAAAIQDSVEPVTLRKLQKHQDADYVISSFADLRMVVETVPRAEATGVTVHLQPDTLEHIARMLSSETLGLITRLPDAIEPLMGTIRILTGFSGQIIATSIDSGSAELSQFVRQADLIAYTPQSRRRLTPVIGERPHVAVAPVISQDALALVRKSIPQ